MLTKLTDQMNQMDEKLTNQMNALAKDVSECTGVASNSLRTAQLALDRTF